jgi:hypothetical protein
MAAARLSGGSCFPGAEVAVLIATTLFGRKTGSGRSRMDSAKPNIAEVAPLPMASEPIARAVKPSTTTRSCLPPTS